MDIPIQKEPKLDLVIELLLAYMFCVLLVLKGLEFLDDELDHHTPRSS
jgi:hypothetical protein